MGSESATSSRASIVSIDPAVASQITSTTQTTSPLGHFRAGSTPAKTRILESSRGHARNRSAPVRGKNDKTTSNSLRRAKDSAEVLRQRSGRSTKSAKKSQLETIVDSREGRNFTIGNVGTGGVLYLKPSAHQNASLHTSPPAMMPLTAPTDLPAISVNDENLRPLAKGTRSDSPSTAKRNASPKRSLSKPTRRPTIETARKRHGRSQSFSTVDEPRPPAGGRSRTLKIVINRPPSDGDTQDTQQGLPQLTLPTLEVPIPHYRIGNPRFSENGTPALRASSYTRTSATPSETGSAPTIQPQKSTGPPTSSARAFARLEAAENRPMLRPTETQRSVSTSAILREPIRPEIYDNLVEVYDDPAVVRYSQNVREVMAATPARIIAQISSESFMDYELVSDFFLTFRSYMLTYTVLDLLLARLRWAIDRQEDDGRIIRVRTFAALRHWILNYFLDDFMADRKLRVRFCNEINKMYADVSKRKGNGLSDLKVLRDLKRCWNGRCSMYWDSSFFHLEGDQDEDLQPGGDEELEVLEKPIYLEGTPPLPPFRVKGLSNSSWFQVPPAETQHPRQTSAGKQESIQSEQSVQAKSCSIPKGLLLRGNDVASPDRGSHPVPVQIRRAAPANLQIQTKTHRRGAASIDSDREPTPRDISMASLQLPLEQSIIRGAVFGPSEPFVQVMPSPSMSAPPNFESTTFHPPTRGGSPHSAQTPAVKNIFGSLKKALGGRHGHSDMALMTVSAPMPIHESDHRRSPMPLNMSKSHDELRSRPPANKGQIRIDLLCAQVAQNYQQLFRQVQPLDGILNVQPVGQPPVDPLLLTPDLRKDRLPSHTTAQSGSIVIINDTGIEVPAMSGALHSRASIPNEWQETSQFGLGIAGQNNIPADIKTQRSSDALGGSETISVIHNRLTRDQQDELKEAQNVELPLSPRTQHTNSTVGSTPTLRNRKSFQSSIHGHHPKASDDATNTTISPISQEEDEIESRMPAHGLRRRPGGDLRKVENVHDLDHPIHHESLVSTTTAGGSPIQSFLEMDASKRPVEPVKKTVSMINTHSSQHLRPSFEAAVAGFSDIPDDVDGGLEATLLKLEGRYDKHSPPLEQHPLDATERRRSMPEIGDRHPLFPESVDISRVFAHRRNNTQEGNEFNEANSRKSSIFGLPLGSEPDSEDSPSLPQLKRDTGSASYSHSMSQPSTSKVMPSPLHLQKAFAANDPKLEQQKLSIIRPETAASAHSFLLDEDENLSDLSSEISVDIINYTHAMDRSNSPVLAAPGTAVSGLEIPAHPLTYASVVDLAPPENQRASTIEPLSRTQSPTKQLNATRVSGGPAHIPFVLACDSQVLAQQLTLIEKSALTEIEWSDLVDMKWTNSPPKALDWAEVLAKSTVQGVDLVITRFNLVSKWVRSEIVLTQNIEERAQVITKLIHVAAHARRLHNYATMVQVTIGLTSSDCTRLDKTWERVSAPDRSLLKNMERLVQPVRNFHELRTEIESADFSDGCIPFIGLYVQDMTYNAQKPAEIMSMKGGEPLINFERYRTAAVIVKNLLRLIDASSRYQFEPVRGIVEKCLWLAALPEQKIYALSKSLE